MKKTISLITALLVVFVLSACGRSEGVDMQNGSVTHEATNDRISVDIPVNGETEKEPSEDKKPENDREQENDNAGEDKEVGRFDLEKKEVLLNSGYEMPIFGLGTYSLDHDTCVNSVKTLLQNGGRLIDTAYMYGNEEAVGEGVQQAMDEYDIPREEIFVITKIYPSQFNDPETAIDMALEKLDIGYIDMMLLHHPGNGDVEAYKTMERYVEEGKIHSLGLSNWYVEELTEFLPQITITPVLVQNEIHPYYQEQEVVPFIQDKARKAISAKKDLREQSRMHIYRTIGNLLKMTLESCVKNVIS